MACTSSCLTKAHKSYGECLASKRVATTGLETTGPSFSTSRQKQFDRELDLYQSATSQGIQPPTTQTKDIRAALDMSDATGSAYRADQ